MSYFDAKTIKEAAAGNWLAILEDIAPSLKAAVGKCGSHVPCPVHGGKDGFRLYHDAPVTGAAYSNKCGNFSDGFAVLQFVTGLGFKEVLALVAQQVGYSVNAPMYVKPKPLKKVIEVSDTLSNEEYQERGQKLKNFWGLTRSLNENDPVVKYLRSRGIRGDWILKAKNVRHHPRAYINVNKVLLKKPCMALRFTSKEGKSINIHRTFLEDSGEKMGVDKPKLQMKGIEKMRGGAVRIGNNYSILKNGGRLHLAEGFENAASIADLYLEPVAATLSASLMQTFEPPQEVKELVIWADNDDDGTGINAGLDSANKLIAKLLKERPDIKVILKLPPSKEEDWNDLYRKSKLSYFDLQAPSQAVA